MAITQGTGAGGGQKRRKREKQEPAFRPDVAALKFDAEEAGRAVVGAYFDKTGKLPATDTFNSMVKLVANNPAFRTYDDVDRLFPDWVREAENPDDISPLRILIDPAKEIARHMLETGEIVDVEELRARRRMERVHKEAEERREHGKVPLSEEDVEKAERFIWLSQGATGLDMFYRDWNSEDEEAARFSDSAAERRVMEGSPLMVPSLISKARATYMGRSRDELTAEQRLQLDALAQRLAWTYGEEFVTHYANSTENVVWDDFFDSHVASLVVEANLCYVLQDSPLDPDGKWKKQAMKNISVATYGEVRPTGDEYELLRMLGIKGKEGDNLRASDEWSEMLFAGFYNARRGFWTEREATIAYAADFGEEALPPSMRPSYDEYMKDWNPHIAAGVAKYEQLAKVAEQAQEKPGLVGLDHDAAREAIVETILSIGGAAGAIPPDEELLAPGADEPRTGAVGKAVGARRESSGANWVRANIMRHMVLPAAGIKESTLLGDTAALDVPYDIGLILGMNCIMATMGSTADLLGMSPDRAYAFTREEKDKLLKAGFSEDEWGDISAMWWLAKEQALALKSEGMATSGTFLRRFDERYGTNLAENSYLRFALDFTPKLMLDIAVTGGVSTIGRGMLRGGASSMRLASIADKGRTALLIGERADALQGAKLTVGRSLVKLVGKGADRRMTGIENEVARLTKAVEAEKATKAPNEQYVRQLEEKVARLRDEWAELASRPMLYDTLVEGLARGQQRVSFLKLLFGYTDDGLGWKTRAVTDAAGNVRKVREVDSMLKGEQMKKATALFERMAKSRDVDEIYDIASTLYSEFGLRISPDATFFSVRGTWNRLSGVYESGATFQEALPHGRRYVNAADNPLRLIDAIGTLTNMGLPRGDRRGGEILGDLLERAATATGKTAEDIHQARQRVWEEMWDIIDDNLRARKVSASERRAVKLLARISGVSVKTPENRLDLFAAIQKIKRGGKGARGRSAAKAARMYMPGYDVDEETGAMRLVELSKVKKPPVPKDALETAQRIYDDAASVYETVSVEHRLGRVSGKELEGARIALQNAESQLKMLKEVGKRAEAQPFLEGQLAKDLIARYNPLELHLFLTGLTKVETLAHIGLLYGRGPSVHSGVSAFRTFILARLGFGASASLGDEFWRLIPEGVWSTIIGKNGEFRQRMKELKEAKQMARAVANNLTDMLRNSDAWVGVSHEAPDYHVWLNGYLEMLRSENTVKMMQHLPRFEGETTEAYAKRIANEIRKLVDGTSSIPHAEEIGAIMREHLRQMGRAPQGGLVPRREQLAALRGTQAAREAAEAEYTQAFFALEDNLSQQAKLAEEVGKLGRPTKEFEAKWLRENHWKFGTERPPKPGSGLRRSRLRTRRKAEKDIDKLTDREVRERFSDILERADVRARIREDYHRFLVAKRGKASQYDELLRLKEERKALEAAKRAANRRRRAYQAPPKNPDTSALDEWIDLTTKHLVGWERFPLARAALFDGKKLSKGEVKQLVAEMLEEGITPPPVIGVTTIPRWGDGYIPGLSQWAELGPFRILDWMTNSMRKATFTHWHMRHYDDLIKRGLDDDMAWGRALQLAEEETNRAMFSHNMTAWEYATRDILLFQPAFRQFILYWGGQFVRNPLVMRRLYNTFGTQYPTVRIPGTQMETTMPMPFWLTGDISESLVPGVTPLILAPLRTANYATGWEWDEEQKKYIYTGATDLDWMERIPGLSFASKSSSPLSWIDDLLWGIRPDWVVPDGNSSFFWVLLDSGRMSFFKDPKKREQFAMNIAQAQIANGMKPDWTAGIDEMRDKPFWWRLIEGIDILNIVENPDAVLSAGTKLLNPLTGRLSYDPSIMSPAKTKFFWEKWAGTTPRTMADAQYEYMRAYGNEKKQNEVLAKFPKFAEVVRFWDMDIEEREEYLSHDRNLWIIPYITGKYFYDNGIPLVGGEFWTQVRQGSIYRKNLNAFLQDIQETYLNVGYTRTLRKMEREHKQAMKEADAFAKKTIDRLAGDNRLLRQSLRDGYEAYRKFWTDPAPGDDYSDAQRHPPVWLVLAAREAGIEQDVFKWDAGAIAKRMTDAYRLVSDGGKRLEAQGVYEKIEASTGGVADRWTHRGIYDRDEYDEKLGAALRLADGLRKYISPRWKYLTDPKYSAYWTEISGIVKKRRDYNDYLTQKFASGEYWKIHNPNELLAIGVKTKNLPAMEQGMHELNLAYWEYRKAIEGVAEGSDRYKAIRAAFIQKRNAILEREGMEAFRDGPAGRLYAAYGKYGRGVGRNWLDHVVATMTKKDSYSPEALVDRWVSQQTQTTAYHKRAERAAWASLCLVAMRFREELKGKWNETMAAYGYSPDSKAASVYLRKLNDYAKIWSRVSPGFRRRFSDMGGERLIANMLDPNF